MWLSDAMWPSPVAVGPWPGAFDGGGRRVQSHCLRRINRLGLKLLKSGSEWVYDRSRWKIVDVLQWQGKMRTYANYIYIYVCVCVFDWQIGGFNYSIIVDLFKLIHVPFQCVLGVSTTKNLAMLPLQQATRSNAPGPVASWNAQLDVTTRPAGWGRQQWKRSWPPNSDVSLDLLFFGFMNIENGLYYVILCPNCI